MELITGSETSTHLIQTPEIYPENNTLNHILVYNDEPLLEKGNRNSSKISCFSHPTVTGTLNLNEVIPLCIESIYSFILYIYILFFSQHNYIV
jgi:hypothetical protein